MGTFWGTLRNLGSLGSLGSLEGTLGTFTCEPGNLYLGTWEPLLGNLGTFTWEPLLGNLGTFTLGTCTGNLYLEPGNLGGIGFGAAPVCSETFTMAEDPKAFCCWGKIKPRLDICQIPRFHVLNLAIYVYFWIKIIADLDSCIWVPGSGSRIPESTCPF